MAKCQRCNGKGIMTVHNVGTDENFRTECDICHGTGEYEPFDLDVELDKLYPTEMTNEEWRKTCSAEEFAVWLWKHFDHGEVIVLWEKYGCPMYKDDNGESRADYTEAMKKWLREIHKE